MVLDLVFMAWAQSFLYTLLLEGPLGELRYSEVCWSWFACVFIMCLLEFLVLDCLWVWLWAWLPKFAVYSTFELSF